MQLVDATQQILVSQESVIRMSWLPISQYRRSLCPRSAAARNNKLTLSPGCKISGGKVLLSHTRKTTNRVAALLRLTAVTVGKSNTYAAPGADRYERRCRERVIKQ
ncbi:hypothetical protein KQH49_00175 [Mycetohabitans sp. B5]|nr:MULTISPECIES: hypothetical protein [Mycetohabitans]MCG1053460.1 hypothetical protein [Mycetohabitans sp. B5]